MQFIIGLLMLFSLVSGGVGAVMCFWKDKRADGKRLMRNNFIFLIILIFAGYFFEDNQTNEKITSQTDTVGGPSEISNSTLNDNNKVTPSTPKSSEESDKQGKKEEKINPNLDPQKNITRIIDYLNRSKTRWAPVGEKPCITETYCAINIGKTKVEAMGGYVKVWLSTDSVPEKYMAACTAVLSGLSGITKEQTKNYVAQAFIEGGQGNRSKFKIGEVDMTVNASSDSRQQCSFFRMTK